LLFALAACDSDCPRAERCDIRDRDCQRAIMSAVVCLRGGDDERLPKVSVISEDEFVERVAAYRSDDPDAHAEREASYALWSRALALFDLARTDYDMDDALADSASMTAAAYFPDDGEIVIVARGGSLASDAVIGVFAHEVVHALQDRDLDLISYQRRWRTSYDAALALDAIIEGEAVHYQILATAQLTGRELDDLRWEHLYRQWRAAALVEAEQDDAPVTLAYMRFPYAFGGGFVTQHWLARGRAGIDSLFENPPRTTSEVLFGTGASTLETERAALYARAVPELPEPFADQGATALGAWIARIYAARADVPVGLRLDPARGLGADLFSVHHDAARDEVVAAWRARMIEGAAPQHWPGLAHATRSRFIDLLQREASLLAAETELPGEPDRLAWRAPAYGGEDSDPAAAAVGSWFEHGRGFHRACAVARAATW
jgi:hypothetical protein